MLTELVCPIIQSNFENNPITPEINAIDSMMGEIIYESFSFVPNQFTYYLYGKESYMSNIEHKPPYESLMGELDAMMTFGHRSAVKNRIVYRNTIHDVYDINLYIRSIMDCELTTIKLIQYLPIEYTGRLMTCVNNIVFFTDTNPQPIESSTIDEIQNQPSLKTKHIINVPETTHEKIHQIINVEKSHQISYKQLYELLGSEIDDLYNIIRVNVYKYDIIEETSKITQYDEFYDILLRFIIIAFDKLTPEEYVESIEMISNQMNDKILE